MSKRINAERVRITLDHVAAICEGLNYLAKPGEVNARQEFPYARKYVQYAPAYNPQVSHGSSFGERKLCFRHNVTVYAPLYCYPE